jgi:hypothetical protein
MTKNAMALGIQDHFSYMCTYLQPSMPRAGVIIWKRKEGLVGEEEKKEGRREGRGGREEREEGGRGCAEPDTRCADTVRARAWLPPLRNRSIPSTHA